MLNECCAKATLSSYGWSRVSVRARHCCQRLVFVCVVGVGGRSFHVMFMLITVMQRVNYKVVGLWNCDLISICKSLPSLPSGY